MKYTSEHWFTISFCPNTFGSHYESLLHELKLFKEAWPNAMLKTTNRTVSIGYKNFPQGENLAYDATMQFREAVKRHSWWKEVHDV